MGVATNADRTARLSLPQVQFIQRAYLLSQLRVGDVDLVVGRMTDSPEIQGMNFEHLYSESMTLVVRAGHPLTGKPLDRSLLEHYPWVVPLANTTIRAFADSLFVQCGIIRFAIAPL